MCLTIVFVMVIALQTIHAQIPNPRVCVIGAGIAGLSSARYLKEAGINFTVLEATRHVGGTWRYDPRIGTDENGLPLHTSMYKYLRANLPKPTMELPGYPLPENVDSFPTRQDYYRYLQSFEDHFELQEHIKFLHNVISVTRLDGMWRVRYQNVLTQEMFEEYYDYVFVCTGHYSKPIKPEFPGEKLFKGTIIHSHDYRQPEPYTNRKVLIIGGGPSGLGIGLQVLDFSRTVVHSHHLKVEFKTPYPQNYKMKPDVLELNETGVIFVDGTYEDIDDIIYCTGYQYDYPFLDESCGLNITSRAVTPLYRYTININQPTMAVIGLVVRACLVVAIDAQTRYSTAVVTGNFSLPSQEKMLSEWQKRFDVIHSQGRPISDIHLLADKEDNFYEDLAKESGIKRVPPVIFKIRNADMVAKFTNMRTYRNYVYTVIDNEHFERTLNEDSEAGNEYS